MSKIGTKAGLVPDRSILDNVMATIKIIHNMKFKVKGTLGDVAFKLDISKAYDIIDWNYLRGVMMEMGFSMQWINWIMMCAEIVDYINVLVNENVA